jgi:hypothetical protein
MSDDGRPESMIVQLTRMEGVLNSVSEKVGDLRGRVDRHETDISELKRTTQQLSSDAIAKDLTVIATAKALSEAKEAADAASRAEVAKADRTWTPMTRLFAATTAVAAILAAYAAYRPH